MCVDLFLFRAQLPQQGRIGPAGYRQRLPGEPVSEVRTTMATAGAMVFDFAIDSRV